MNRISNLGSLRIGVITVVTGASLLGLSAPVSAVATVKTSSPFCTNLSTTVTTVNNGIADKISKLDAARTARTQEITNNRAKWDAELAANRIKWDAERQANFTKLEAKATTDDQKSAVQAYETSVKDAVSTRRAANDAARDTYRTGVDATINARRTTIDNQVDALKAAVAAAISTAQDGCAADPANGPTLRVAFVASLKTARTTFQLDRKDDNKIATEVAALATTKHTTIAANDSTFKAATAAARATLKSHFGSTNV